MMAVRDMVQSYLQQVAGDMYTDIVETCLRADELEKQVRKGESTVSIAVRLQRIVAQDIVRRLRVMESALSVWEG